MFDIFVREALTTRTLRQTDSFSESLVIGFAVCRVEIADRIPAFDANGHFVWRVNRDWMWSGEVKTAGVLAFVPRTKLPFQLHLLSCTLYPHLLSDMRPFFDGQCAWSTALRV